MKTIQLSNLAPTIFTKCMWMSQQKLRRRNYFRSISSYSLDYLMKVIKIYWLFSFDEGHIYISERLHFDNKEKFAARLKNLIIAWNWILKICLEEDFLSNKKMQISIIYDMPIINDNILICRKMFWSNEELHMKYSNISNIL